MFLFLVGCGPDEAPAVEDTGPGLPSGEAYGCVEADRVPITDTRVAAEGMVFAPDEVVDIASGGWDGTFAFVSGEVENAAFAVDPGGTWELVTRVLHDGGGGAEGAPDEACGAYYSWSTAAALVEVSDALDETFAATVSAFGIDQVSLVARIPLDEVGGTTRPAAWDPADWAENALVVSGYAWPLWVSGAAAPGAWEVSVLWQASSGADAKGEGGSDTATVSPSGMTEGVGSGEFTPN